MSMAKLKLFKLVTHAVLVALIFLISLNYNQNPL